jgi:predicted membrane-bound spermidine synthase
LAAPRAAGHRWLLLALALFFFCSGLSALIYQVLWLRMLGWVFGVTIYAASAVWAAFMAGLAIGSYVAGVAGDRVRSPLRWFGATEILIGATALATPNVLEALQSLYVRLYPSLPDGLGVLTAARLIIAFAVLIVPTVLMGATLPLVLKASTFRASALVEQVGVLYGSNAAGAIVGTLAAGLYLIPELGIARTFFVAAGLNVLVGTSAVALSTFAARDVLASAPVESGVSAPGEPPIADRSGLQLILVVFTLSGAVSLALEVVWFRVLTMFLRPTVYGFSVMLATILAGISLGSYVATPWLGRRIRWMTIVAALELAIGIAIVLSFRPLVYLHQLTGELAPSLSTIMPEYLVYPIAGSLLAIFPTALLMGMAFPIGLRLWVRQAATRRSASASLFAERRRSHCRIARGRFPAPAPLGERDLAGAACGGQLLLRHRVADRCARTGPQPAGDRRGGRGDLRLGGLDVARSVRAVHGAALRRHRSRLEAGRRRGNGRRA